MGYSIRQTDGQFQIAAPFKAQALAALKTLAAQTPRLGYTDSADVLDCDTLRGALRTLSWASKESEERLYALRFDGESAGAEDEVMAALGPFVSAGSYIDMIGADGEKWRYAFDGKRCQKLDAQVTWVAPVPAESKAATSDSAAIRRLFVSGWVQSFTMDCVVKETLRARKLFPSEEHRLAALTEEAMELIQAVLGGKPLEEIHKEAIQLAGQCIRLLEEGDSDYPSTLIDYEGRR